MATMTDTHAAGATDGATTAGQSTGYVEVDHLSLGYRRRQSDVFHYACADLDFNIARGEFVVIVGTSGCGKTTFLEALAGLVPVAGGEMRLGRENTERPRSRQVARVPEPFALSLDDRTPQRGVQPAGAGSSVRRRPPSS